MNLFYITYKTITTGLFLILFPVFRIFTILLKCHGKNLNERLGQIPESSFKKLSGSPRLWIHAASLGEVKVAYPIIESLKCINPDCSIIISTITESGRNQAKKTFSENIPIIYAPIDLVYAVRKTLRLLRPDVLIFIETEIWPAWIMEASKMGVKIALVNGRISEKSFKRYLKLKPFFQTVLSKVDAFSMIMDHDGSRIEALGAAPDKVQINGNSKYDLLSQLADPAIKVKMVKQLSLQRESDVIVAGSTRSGEENLLFDVYDRIVKEYPDTIIIIAPRHIKRVYDIGKLITNRGYKFQLMTDLKKDNSKRSRNIIILNTFGELFNLYSIATVAFCGGSLLPFGGQNPLEPAAWGKPVFYGPYMDNFLDAKILLEKNKASIPTSGINDLTNQIIAFFKNRDRLTRYGKRARQVVSQNSRVAKIHANVIFDLIKN